MTRLSLPRRTSVVAASPDGALDGIDICLLPSPVSTTFSNIYHGTLSERTQVIEALAAPISPEELPPAWVRVPVVLLGPVAREVPPAWVRTFPKEVLVGITPQGWMRKWDEKEHVSPTPPSRLQWAVRLPIDVSPVARQALSTCRRAVGPGARYPTPSHPGAVGPVIAHSGP